MKILSIETSCDETAISIVEATGGLDSPHFEILGNSLFSQIDIHKEFGGVFPIVAKREHAKKLPPLLVKTLTEANMYQPEKTPGNGPVWAEIERIVSREEGIFTAMQSLLDGIKKPEIDVISVTSGPGLEPALWVGISFAIALSKLWDIPHIGINHMEGHIYSVLLTQKERVDSMKFPSIALLISGGHTEIVEIKNWGEYKVLGQTRDDAVGEAFDKVARMLSLPYPGGPEISRLAEIARAEKTPRIAKFPRPMIHSDDLDFSFSGLKTSVLYYIKNIGDLSENAKRDIAREFEDTVVEVLLKKTAKAVADTSAQTLIIAGGVIANKKIRESFLQLEEKIHGLTVLTPSLSVSTDNALMIACATYIQTLLHPELLTSATRLIARGNIKLGDSI